MNILFFDTETTGFVRKGELIQPGQARCVQLGALLCNEAGVEHSRVNEIIKPDLGSIENNWSVPAQVAEIHGITTEIALEKGKPAKEVFGLFQPMVEMADIVVAHNFSYDDSIMKIEEAYGNLLWKVKSSFCTMRESTDYCAIPKKQGWGGYKWPKLQEAHKHFFGVFFDDAHDAFADLLATQRVYAEILKLKAGPPSA